MKLLRKVGVTSEIWQIFIQDSSSATGAGLAGLVYNSGSLTAYFHRDADTTDTAITLVDMTLGTFTSGGFKEVDATHMPGWYQFCPPNTALASGAKSCGFHLQGATNMAPLPIEVDLNGEVAEVATVTGNVAGNVTGTIGGFTAAALAEFFTIDTTKVYADAVAGSVVKELASHVTLADGVAHGGTPGSSTATFAMSLMNLTNLTGEALTVLTGQLGANAATFTGGPAANAATMAGAGLALIGGAAHLTPANPSLGGPGLSIVGGPQNMGALPGPAIIMTDGAGNYSLVICDNISAFHATNVSIDDFLTVVGPIIGTSLSLDATGAGTAAITLQGDTGFQGIISTGGGGASGIYAVGGALAHGFQGQGGSGIGSSLAGAGFYGVGGAGTGGGIGVPGGPGAYYFGGADGGNGRGYGCRIEGPATGGLIVIGDVAVADHSAVIPGTLYASLSAATIAVSGSTTLSGVVTADSDSNSINLGVAGLAKFFLLDTTKVYADAVAGSVVKETASFVTLSPTGLSEIVPVEPVGAPVWSTTNLEGWMAWTGAQHANKRITTDGLDTLRNAADNLDIATATIADNGVTCTRGKYVG